MTKPRDPAIVNLENQVEGDIKKSVKVVKDIFSAVIGVSNVGKPEVATRTSEAELESDGRTITVRGQPDRCLTCGGKGLVGRPGHEVTCPICGGGSCKTCGGTRKVGAPGYEIDCPKCCS